MPAEPAVAKVGLTIGLVILAAVAAGAVAVWQMDPWGGNTGTSPAMQPETGEDPTHIDPALIAYEQTGSIPVAVQEVHALAVGPEDRIYVGGDQALQVFDSGGTKHAAWSLGGQPKCIAVGRAEHAFPGRVYVGMVDHVEVLGPSGQVEATWATLGPKAVLTSIALAEDDVFVADAGNKIVCRYDTAGNLVRRIGQRDPARKIPGFIITSAYFDLAVAPDGLLRVVNPRALRIEAYTFDGDLEFSWGKSSPTIEGFFGCCNPAHIALLGDGRLVTAEKGISRVKVYGAQGEFERVVCGPQQMEAAAADLAVDSRDRVLILDPSLRSVRVFHRRQTAAGGPSQ